ncbi:MAG: hypothetical protein HYX32_01660 [Actinobacteria bacterium]|nr:hypothetical protein [Actinomycetota bacterium]
MEEPKPHHKSPIDHALDLFVFAPVGFVAEAPSLLPRFVKRGRDQVAMVRALGLYAIHRDTGALQDVVEHHPSTRSTLQALGLVRHATKAERRNGSGRASTATLTSVPDPGDADVPTPVPVEPEGSQDPGVDPATLAIPDYESLSASQVVPRLESLTTTELEAIRQYENGNRARRTILNKIAQLQAS